MIYLVMQGVTADEVQALSEHMMALGGYSISIEEEIDPLSGENPIFEPKLETMPLWPLNTVRVLFQDRQTAMTATQSYSDSYSNPYPYTFEALPEIDWLSQWKTQAVARCFGDTLWILPSFHKPPYPEGTTVFLDPGLAFGTGAHASTQLCLHWLAKQALSETVLIDYGTGSGILGISALKLGAAHVYAVDVDEQALIATQDNAARNGLSLTSLSTVFPNELPDTQCDKLVANLLLYPLCNLVETFAALCKPGAQIALSGLLNHQAKTIVDIYQPWFQLDVTEQEEWSLCHGIRRNRL